MSDWISTASQFPNPEQEVRLFCKINHSEHTYQCIGFYIPEKFDSEESDYSWDYEALDYDDETDTNYVHPGWYERIYNWDDYGTVGINDEVLYWQPLDDGPEGE